MVERSPGACWTSCVTPAWGFTVTRMNGSTMRSVPFGPRLRRPPRSERAASGAGEDAPCKLVDAGGVARRRLVARLHWRDGQVAGLLQRPALIGVLCADDRSALHFVQRRRAEIALSCRR